MLANLAANRTVAQVARLLNTSSCTLHRKLKVLCGKLGVPTRTQALVEAKRRGLV